MKRERDPKRRLIDNFDMRVDRFITLVDHPVDSASYKEALSRYFIDVKQIGEWDNTMSRKVYRIELKIDFTDDDRHDQMLEIAKDAARTLAATAALLQDKKPPEIALITDDYFLGKKDFDLTEDAPSA